MRAQREAYQRARSVQSQTGVGVGGAYDLHHVPILVTDDGVCNSAGHAAAVGGIGVGVASAGAVDPRVAVSGPPSGGDTRRAPPGWARQASLPVYAGQHFRHPSFDQVKGKCCGRAQSVLQKWQTLSHQQGQLTRTTCRLISSKSPLPLSDHLFYRLLLLRRGRRVPGALCERQQLRLSWQHPGVGLLRLRLRLQVPQGAAAQAGQVAVRAGPQAQETGERPWTKPYYTVWLVSFETFPLADSQVTICEDSISIADSQVFSRQGSRSDSRVSLVHAGIIGPHPPPRIPSGLSASPVPSCTGGGGGGGGTQQQQHQQQHSFTPSPVLPLEQQQQQQPTAASAQLPPRRLPSPVPSLVPSVAPSTYLGTAAASAAAVHHHPPPRLCPMLPRQESSFTTEEINRYVRTYLLIAKLG